MADPLADNANVDALMANIEEVSRLAEESLASAPLGISSSAASALDEGSAAPRRSTRRRRASSVASATEAGAAKRSRTDSNANDGGITAAAVASSSGAPSLLAVTEDMLAPAALQQWRDDDTLPEPQRIERLKARVLALSEENSRLRSLVSSLAGAGADGSQRLAALLAAGQVNASVVPGVSARGNEAAINAVARAVLRQQSEAAAIADRVTTVEGRQAMAAARAEALGGQTHQARRKNRKQPRKKAAVTPGLVLPPDTAPLDFTVVPDGFENMALGAAMKSGRPSKEEIAGVRTVVRCGRRVTTRFGYHGVSMDRRTQVFQGFIGVPSNHPAYDAANKRPAKCGTARTPFLAALIREVRAVNVYRMTPSKFPDFLWNFAEASRKWIDEDEVAFLGPDPELLPDDFNDSENVPGDIPPPPRPTGSKEPPAEVPKFSQRKRGVGAPKAPSDVVAFFGEEEVTRHTAATADSAASASGGVGAASSAPGSLAGDSLGEFDDLDLPDMDFDSINGDDEMGAVAEAAAAEFAEEYKAGQAGAEGYGFEALAAAGLQEVQGEAAALAAVEGELGQRTRRSGRTRGGVRKEHTTKHLLGGPHTVGAVGLPPPEGVDVGGEDPRFWRAGCRSNTGYYGVWRCDHPVQPYRGRIKVRKNEPKEHHETTAFRAAIAREIEALEPPAQVGSCTTRRFRWNFAHRGWVDFENANYWRWVGPLPSDLPPTATEDMVEDFWTEEDTKKARAERPYGSLHPERFPSSHSARKARRTKAAARSRTATRAAAEAHKAQLMAELAELPPPARRRGVEDEEREAAEAASAAVAAAGGAPGAGGQAPGAAFGAAAYTGGEQPDAGFVGHDEEHDELVAAAEEALAAEAARAAEAALATEKMDSAVL